jgi:hypothetical protein
VRTDCTVVESNIHDPKDSELLWDCVRVLSRLLGQARDLLGADKVEFGIGHDGQSGAARRSPMPRTIRSGSRLTKIFFGSQPKSMAAG